jgi:uncharacterized membrane protein YqgA involved in biofilm formation
MQTLNRESIIRGKNMNNQVENKPTAAYILSLLGGIFGILGSLAFIGFGALAYVSYTESYSYYYGYSYYDSMFGWSWATLLGFGVWMLITSILLIVFAGKLKANPMEHTKWGVLILIFSIIGVGGLLGIIGGILALVYKPRFATGYPQQQGYAPQGYQQQPYQQQYQQQQQPITKIGRASCRERVFRAV